MKWRQGEGRWLFSCTGKKGDFSAVVRMLLQKSILGVIPWELSALFLFFESGSLSGLELI